jgi:DNA processing protein
LDNEIVYKLALNQIPGIGPVLAKNLISYCGGVKQVFSKSTSFLKKAPGIGYWASKNVKAFTDFTRAEKEARFIQENNIKALFFLDKDYPVRLKNIPDGPIVLYVKGEVNLNAERCVAVVGTRKMTHYGKFFINQLIEEIAPYDPLVVSGLAYGVDVWAHKQCVKLGVKTLGVVAHGLDRIYPSRHTNLAREMVKEGGGVATEYMTETEPYFAHFPTRNRIVAGLVDAVVVVESAAKGGSLITGELGNQYNRDVFALPGNVGNTYSEGCNFLIKSHKANLIQNGEDIVKMLNWDVKLGKQKQRKLFVELSENEQKVLDLVRLTKNDVLGIGIDELMVTAEMTSSVLAMTLLELEMKNCIASLPGKRYQII